MKRVLSIAGSDPSAGAGVQLDLRVLTHLGVYGMTAITAVTAQNTMGVQKIATVAPRMVAAQIDSVTRDIGVDAVKIGMLHSAAVVETVAERIKRRSMPNVILDPILGAKDGTSMLLKAGVRRMKRFLLPEVLVITPNAREAEVLTGIKVHDTASQKEAAAAIHGMGPRYVLIKGGHLEGEPLDLLYDGESFIEFPGVRVEGAPVHGTGCAFSAALAARIALGDTVAEAAASAKDFVREQIESAQSLGKGNRLITI